jgi:hypothetical protein
MADNINVEDLSFFKPTRDTTFINTVGVGPRADFKPEIFDTAIIQKGYRVVWQQSMYCSCINQQTGSPDYNCPACYGKGYLYFGDKLTRALVTSISDRKEVERIGVHEIGGAYLTPLSTDNVGYRDRFIFPDFTTKFSEVITRGSSDTDYLRYKCKGIVAVRQLNEIYIEDVDFKIITDDSKILGQSRIQWQAPSIDPGTNYSILYMMHPYYIVMNPIHELRGTYTKYKGGGEEYFMQLPKQYQIKREDFLESNIGGNLDVGAV